MCPSQPLVTVLMPVFNRDEFVDEAIRSVLDQDFTDFELLIVDDGSTDHTPAILRGWAQRDARIVIVTCPVNQGVAAALNEGLARARAPYVARFDSDDIMMPRRLRAQAEVLERNPDVVLVSSAFEVIDRAGRPLGLWETPEPHEAVVYFLKFYNVIGGHGQVMYRRADVAALGGYSTEYPSSEDSDLWPRLLERGRFVALPLVGMKRRLHEGQSHVHHAAVKRANWSGMMRRSLSGYLGRPVSQEEVAPLVTLWRTVLEPGMARGADRVLREAYARFCREHADRSLRRIVRRRTARQWIDTMDAFVRAGRRGEAMRYFARGLAWSPGTVAGIVGERVKRVLMAMPVLGRGLRIPGAVRRRASRLVRRTV